MEIEQGSAPSSSIKGSPKEFCGFNEDALVKSQQDGRHSKKFQMQGTRILRNEAYIEVRRKPAPAKAGERCLPASGGKRNAADGLFTKSSSLETDKSAKSDFINYYEVFYYV